MIEKFSSSQGWLIVLLLATAIIANVMFAKTAGWTRLAIGLAVYAILLGILYASRLSLQEVGLSFSTLRQGFVWGLFGSILVAVVLGMVLYISPDTFKDQRYNQDIGSLLLAIFITLPIYTVLIEELLFRGIIPAMFGRNMSVTLAYVASSVLFGLWHILPSLTMKSVSLFGGTLLVPRLAVIASSVVAPFLAGLVLSWLAFRSKSLIAPILVHWTINAVGMVFAAIAWGRL
jgi:membrane protease YdiL (CAAX protease family)